MSHRRDTCTLSWDASQMLCVKLEVGKGGGRAMSRRYMLALGVLSVLLFLNAPPAPAHGLCPVVTTGMVSPLNIGSQVIIGTTVVKTVQVTGGFTPTVLDVWAFPGAFSPVSSPSIVRQVVVCPSVVVVPSVVSPVVIGAPSVFLDPPAPVQPAPSGTSSAPVHASGPVVTGVVPKETVRDLATNPGQYDRQIATVTGTIASSQAHRDVHGRPYTQISLESDGAAITVVVWGQAGLRTGMRARVVGPFYDVSPFAGEGGGSLRDVLEAQLIEATP